MVSYYNHLQYTQKHPTNLPYQPAQTWFSPNYPPPPNAHLFSDVDHQHVYYNPQIFQSPPEWQPHENYPGHQTGLSSQGLSSAAGGNNSENVTEGLPSPPITVSGSEMSSPGVPHGAISPHAPSGSSARPTPDKSPFYDWMKKPSYPAQPNPGNILGKTRTKDKYRVVYTDFQRLELEKEYHTSRYITIRRKTELAQALQLSERQVKIWFQNRRAKERKQNKKREDPLSSGLSQHPTSGGIGSIMETKPKLEPGLHLPHSLHQMSSMAIGMSHMGIHPSVLHHSHHLGVAPHPPSSQHLHQSHQTNSASVGALTM